MKFFATVAAFSAFVASVIAQGDLVIQTPPSLVVCQPAAIIFSGGSPPYFITVIPAGQIAATPLKQFPQQDAAGSFTWNPVDLPVGTNVTIAIRDGAGLQNFAAPVVVQAGTSTACLDGSATSATTTTSDAATTTTGATTTTTSGAATTTTATTTASGTTTTGATTTSATTSTSESAPAATTSAPGSGASTFSAGASTGLAAAGLFLISQFL